jgi:hypothetical protein
MIDMRRNTWQELGLIGLLFVGLLTPYLLSGNNVPIDSKWSLYTAMSIWREGNTNLDEYQPLIDEVHESYPLETIEGHIYSIYPLGAPLAALPFVIALDTLSGGQLSTSMQHTLPGEAERLVASCLVAMTGVLLYGIARLSLRRRESLFLAVIFGLGTSAWSVASRALWQHGPSMLWLTATLYLLLLARRRPAVIQLTGLTLALAYVTRPTNSISILLVSIYVLVFYRKYLVGYLAGALLVAVPFAAFNDSVYGAPLSNYYRAYQEFSFDTLGEALLGQWVSPARGLLVFSPVLIFSLAGMALKVRRHCLGWLDRFLIAIIGLHWLTISVWPVWWGGWTFGPRMFSDMLPYFIYFMIPVLAVLPEWPQPRRAMTIALGLLLSVVSVFVHYRGANAWETLFEWNALPAPINLDPSHLWEWRDVQFLRGIKYAPQGTPINLALDGVPVEQLAWSTRDHLGGNDVRVRRFDGAAALIAPRGLAWIMRGNGRPLATELAAAFDGVPPVESTRTLYGQQSYTVFHFDLAARLLAASRQAAHTAQVGATPLVPDQAQRVTLPAKFGETAELLGYSLRRDGDRLTLITYWQAGPEIVTPLQLFVHVLDTDGRLVAQNDQLDVPAEDWQAGDIIEQINRVDLAQVSAPKSGYQVEIGLYNLATGERLPVVVSGQTVDNRLVLAGETTK